MRIICPLCAATYDVPPTLLGQAARKVRCVKCLHEWLPEEAQPVMPAAPAAQPQTLMVAQPTLTVAPPPLPLTTLPQAALPPSPARLADEDALLDPPIAEFPPLPAQLFEPPRIDADAAVLRRPPPRRDPPPRQSLIALTASVLILCGLAAAAVIWRDSVMHAFPPSERLFAALGLH